MQTRRRLRHRAERAIGLLAFLMAGSVGLMSSVTANRLAFLAWTVTALFVLTWALRPSGPGLADPRTLGGFALTAVFWFLCVQRHEEALHTGGRAMDVPDPVVHALAGSLPIVVAAVLGLGAAAVWWRRRTTQLPVGED